MVEKKDIKDKILIILGILIFIVFYFLNFNEGKEYLFTNENLKDDNYWYTMIILLGYLIISTYFTFNKKEIFSEKLINIIKGLLIFIFGFMIFVLQRDQFMKDKNYKASIEKRIIKIENELKKK
jgi:magnesium-transporting ATPase (P-type)